MQYLVQFVQDHPETAAPVHTEHRAARTPIQVAMNKSSKPKPAHKQIFAPCIDEAERRFSAQNPSLTVLQVSRITAGGAKILGDDWTPEKTNRLADEPIDRVTK